MLKQHVWLWVVELEKGRQVLNLYNTTSLSTNYNIFVSKYVPAKTEVLTTIHEAKGSKKVGAVQLYFLTRRKSPTERLPVKHATFKKIYNLPTPHPKEMIEDTMYSIFPALELRMEFYVDILQRLAIHKESIFNVFGSTKFMYATLVSTCTINIHTC